MAHKQMPAYLKSKAEPRDVKRSRARARKSLAEREFDRQATDLPKGVIPAAASVPCPSGDGSTLRVIRNLRHDPIAVMYSRKQLDYHQMVAAEMWQASYQHSQIGTVKAMNPMKEPVDGTPPHREPITDRQQRAMKELRRVDDILGTRGAILTRLVLGNNLSIAQVAQHYGDDSKIMRDRLGWLLRECLNELAKFYGLADKRLASVEALG